jgi:DNA-binding HxlR family transcriptional regulator
MPADLSPSQSSLLIAMMQGVKIVMTFGPKCDRASLLRKGFPGVTHTVKALERDGWIERYDITPKECKFRLTEKAKAHYEGMKK